MRNSLRKVLVLTSLISAIIAGWPGNAAPDSSGYVGRSKPREWKDEAGRVIGRVDAQGRMVLLWWDEAGHLVRMSGVAQRAASDTPLCQVPPGGPAWIHCFIYENRKLAAEIDCVGARHDFAEPRAIDLQGTALMGHHHIAEAGSSSFPTTKGSHVRE